MPRREGIHVSRAGRGKRGMPTPAPEVSHCADMCHACGLVGLVANGLYSNVQCVCLLSLQVETREATGRPRRSQLSKVRSYMCLTCLSCALRHCM
jgi:hypothetical protein